MEAQREGIWMQRGERETGPKARDTTARAAPDAHSVEHLLRAPKPHGTPLLHLLLPSCTTLRALRALHGRLLARGLLRGLRARTKLLSCYAALGDLASARRVLDETPHPDAYTYKVALGQHAAAGRHTEAVALHRDMRRRCPAALADVVLLSLALRASVRSADFRYGRRLHCDAVKMAGGGDGFVANCLVDMYAKAGDLENARKVFDRVLDRNVVSWTSMLSGSEAPILQSLSGCLRNGFAEEGLVLFNEMMLHHVLPSEHTMASVLTACAMLGSLHQGRWIHGSVVKHGVGFNPFIAAAMLDMYAKCGEVEDARRVFDDLTSVDLVLWTTMIVGYTQNGSPLDALLLFVDKKFARIVPNSVTIATVLSASAQLRSLSLGRSIHGMSVKLGVVENDVVMNALVDIQMRVQGSKPDAISVVNVLSACVCLGDILIGKCFHTYAVKCAFMSNIYVNTALLNLYNKCADLPSAQRVFNEMKTRNSVTWGAMIGGYGMQGDSAGSIDLFNEMLKDNIQPNEVVFTSILSTCSHTGMVTVGKKCFDSMTQYFNITPTMKHYACMVDVLARAGNLEEALEFIQKMPMQADVSVWGAFLHGCKLHSRLEFGEEAINRMTVLHPDTPDFYVLMSNLYTSYGMWDKSLSIRRSMKERGLVKLPGCSSVGLENG
ncbi:hypothetical protein ACQ4PT_008952 [Festuca glaucescens]